LDDSAGGFEAFGLFAEAQGERPGRRVCEVRPNLVPQVMKVDDHPLNPAFREVIQGSA
jgi:hypothetical protein